ncbi:MAG: hypothetical protein M1831_001216 [Alyxoria varia]|nr:MAG: hypothetical protein M1831_001216 [Alyxoria varia]
MNTSPPERSPPSFTLINNNNNNNNTDQTSTTNLIRLLEHHYFPSSIPLLRRMQSPARSPDALILSSFPPPPSSPHAEETPDHFSPPPRVFTVGFFERSAHPSIQLWLFSSIQTLPSVSDEDEAETRRQLRGMLAEFRRLRPSSGGWCFAEGEEHGGHAGGEASAGEGGEGKGEEEKQDIILIGYVHTLLARQLFDTDLVVPDTWQVPFGKFIFNATPNPGASDLSDPSDLSLPQSLQWDTVRMRDFDLVKANNPFVRSAATLFRCPGVGVRLSENQGGTLVAWCFFGVDGSVKTAYCVPEWRRHGLARKCVVKLCSEHAGALGSGAGGGAAEERPAAGKETVEGTTMHVDVSLDNEASVRLFESLSARHVWSSYWLRVDLMKVM